MSSEPIIKQNGIAGYRNEKSDAVASSSFRSVVGRKQDHEGEAGQQTCTAVNMMQMHLRRSCGAKDGAGLTGVTDDS